MGTAEDTLYAAWVESGLTLEELRDRALMTMSIVSLSRKLRGKQILTTDECAALAGVLGVVVEIGGHSTGEAA